MAHPPANRPTAPAPIIITGRTLARLGTESAIDDPENRRVVEEALEKVSPDPQERLLLFTALATALSELDLAAEEADEDVLTTPQHENASVLQSVLAEYAETTGKAKAVPPGGREAQFDNADLAGWIGSFFRIIQAKVKGKHTWPGLPAAPTPFDDRARFALLGDWGTNLYGAPQCARSIERDGDFTHLVHLGDVYYSGQSKEIRERFLEPWPRIPGAVSRACNSNHEMYSTGKPYFTETLAAFDQGGTSAFAFQNSHWLVVGLDTAYDDHDLAHDQATWLEGLIANAGARRVVLLSHHQPFSQLDHQGPKLAAKLARVLDAKRIFAWYWGHEHRCVLYDPHPRWGLLGRCCGHGGMPAFRENLDKLRRIDGEGGSIWHELPARHTLPRGLVLDGPNPFVKGHADRYRPNGYATIRFDGEHLIEQVFVANGTAVTNTSPLV